MYKGVGKVVNQLEMLFRCCEKALKDKPEKAGLKSGKTKMKYSEALVMVGVLKDYFALRGAFSIGICKDCTKFSTNRMLSKKSLGHCGDNVVSMFDNCPSHNGKE